MRRVLLEAVQPGAILADDLFNLNGVRMLTRGTSLTESHLSRLADMGLGEVLVEDPDLEDVRIHPSLSPITRQIGLTVFSRLAERVRKSEKLPDALISRKGLELFVEHLMDDLERGIGRPYELVAVPGEDYLPGHALNVAGLAGWMAMRGSLRRQAAEVALAGLLADLGMVRVPDDIRFKSGKLTEDEQRLVRGHVEWSLRLLGRDFSAYSKAAVAGHHERVDGGGYPRGLGAGDIPEAGRLLAVVDTYVALVSDRPYRRRMPAHQALELLMGLAGLEYDMEMVNLLMRTVAAFPLGVRVRLASGRLGVVIGTGNVPTRPVVRITAESDGPVDPWDMDLSRPEHQTEMIDAVLYD